MSMLDEIKDHGLKEKLLRRTQRMLEAKVDEVMTGDVITCDARDPAAAAARMCLENGFLGLLVMKDGSPLGTITVFDLLRLSYEEALDVERNYLKVTVEQVIEGKEMVSINSSAYLREALNLMISKRVRSLPVIDDGQVMGILSYVDMVRWYRRTHDEVRTGKI
ncbi:MAG: CBS domain-containing protein [Leptospiraceae bacterium]|nr:CBS domain-containing protein [Leptospiraceae bacterium]